jgi:hypothetical protein
MRYKSYRTVSVYRNESYILLRKYDTDGYRQIESINVKETSHHYGCKDVVILHDGEAEDSRNIKIGEDSPWFNYDIFVGLRFIMFSTAPYTSTTYLNNMAFTNKVISVIPNLIRQREKHGTSSTK